MLSTHRTTQTQNKCTQTCIPRVGFEPTMLVFERAKIVHALDRAAGHCDRQSVRVTLRLAVYRQSIRLGAQPRETHCRNSFSQLNSCGRSSYITYSLTRGWVCRLQLLLALARAFILGSESRGTSDHILLSQIRDFPFCRLLRIAVLRWRYSTQPPRGILRSATKYYRRI
jgi:hypothetical protein